MPSIDHFLSNFDANKYEIVDLSSVLGPDTYCYPTDPPYTRTWVSQMPDSNANVSEIKTGLHAGTHVDVPLHFIEKGFDICSMPITSFIGSAIAINTPKQPGEDVQPQDLQGADIRRGDMLFFHTGWASRNNTPDFYHPGWPGISAQLAHTLVDIGIKAVGFDSPAADNSQGETNGFPAHKTLLSAGIPIYESLINLDIIAGRRFLFVGVPLRMEGAEASLVRAVAFLSK